MPKDLLDFERVRKNFDRMRDPVPEGVPDRLAEVRAPIDPFLSARDALETLKSEAISLFPDHTAALSPFLDRATRLMGRMETLERSGGEGDEKDAAELKAEFVATIENVEDLCEVFGQLAGRR